MKSPFWKIFTALLPIFMLIVFLVEGVPQTFTSAADYAIVIGYVLSIVAICYWIWVAFFRNRNINGK